MGKFMSKDIEVTTKVFSAFHVFLLDSGYTYSAFNESYTSAIHGRKMLRRNRHGTMNQPMSDRFEQFLKAWLRDGKEFIDSLLWRLEHESEI